MRATSKMCGSSVSTTGRIVDIEARGIGTLVLNARPDATRPATTDEEWNALFPYERAVLTDSEH